MAQPHKLVFVFDMPRHRSHLFFRYLSTHPDVQELWHPFVPASLFGPERLTQHTKNITVDGKETEWAPASGMETYADAASNIQRAVDEAERQKRLLIINEHSQLTYKHDIVLAMIRDRSVTIPLSSNPTMIPDPIFNTLTPIFIVRNPIFAVPSNYISFKESSQLRPGGEDWKLVAGEPIQRRLFDHFRDRNDGKAPLVVDGDDVIWRTDEVRDKLSQALNLEPTGLSSVWEPVPEDQRSGNAVLRYFLQTIDESTGIIRPSEQRPDANLDKAYKDWVGKYGEEIADQLRTTAEENMPHYEYMVQFKI